MTAQGTMDAQIKAASSISKEAFKITTGLFFGIAVLSVIARGAIRIITRRKLALDDYLLFAAFAFLSGVTGLMYYLLDTSYLYLALENNFGLIFQLSSTQVDQVLNESLLQLVFLSLAWTAIFLVKFSFLAFFRDLIRNVSHIRYYYWGVVGLTVLSWMFLTSEPYILCSHFGIEAVTCLSPSRNLLYVSMTGLVTALDALTDILIVSIPIIVLHRARMRTSQKLSLGIFMSLSLVMVCLAIIRASKIHGANSIDVVWEFYWQYMEAAVAVIMGSLTVIRNLHVHNSKSGRGNNGTPAGGSQSSYLRWLLRRSTKNESTAQAGRSGASASKREHGNKMLATEGSTLVVDESFHTKCLSGREATQLRTQSDE